MSEVRSELRAHTRALNALRETQLEQGEAITSIRKELAEHSRAIASLNQNIISLDQKMPNGFATLHTGMTQIVALLNGNPDAAQS